MMVEVMAKSDAKTMSETYECFEGLEIDLLKPSLKNTLLILTTVFSSAYVGASDSWSCIQTTYYSIYEDIERAESQMTERATKLEWIDKDTIGFESFTHKRTSPTSNTFVFDNTGSSVFINDKETPHVVVVSQPQTWMNKFGNLRVRFYSCSP